jgi:hypothetical protein
MLRQRKKSFLFKLAGAVLGVTVLTIVAMSVNRQVVFDSIAETQQDRPAIVTAVPLAVTLVPAGLPVALSDSTATLESSGDKAQLVSAVNFQVASLNAEKLTSLNLAVLEFDPQGALRRVDGFARRVDLSAGRTQTITLPINHLVRTGHRLALTVDRADSADRRWEADFNELARGVATVLAGNPTANVSARNESAASPESGALLCAGGSRRALALAAAGDRSGITSYTCNQQQRSFQFTFNGKALLQ